MIRLYEHTYFHVLIIYASPSQSAPACYLGGAAHRKYTVASGHDEIIGHSEAGRVDVLVADKLCSAK